MKKPIILLLKLVFNIAVLSQPVYPGTTLIAERYNKIRSVGRNMFVVAGTDYFHLYDDSLNYLHNVPIQCYQLSMIATIYPLNYTLGIHIGDKSLTFIKWDGANAPLVINNVEIEGATTFKSVACLDDSTLCFASSISGDLIRFDIRTIEDPLITSNFNLKVTHLTNYLVLSITDSNLKYLFGIKEEKIYNIDPMTLQIRTSLDILKDGNNPLRLLSIMSNPVVVVGYTHNKLETFEILQNGDFSSTGSYTVSSGSELDGIVSIRGTRYIVTFSDNKNIDLVWLEFNNKIQSLKR